MFERKGRAGSVGRAAHTFFMGQQKSWKSGLDWKENKIK